MDYSLIDIRTVVTDDKGSLSFFEGTQDIPFDIRRIYYIYNVPKGEERGGHAHRNLRQMLWCPYGAIDVTLDDGYGREHILLDEPTKGLVVNGLTWREMAWKQCGSVLVVAASDYYDEQDYIRSYESFLQAVFEKGSCR